MPRVSTSQREVETAPIPGVRKQTGGSAIAEGAGVEMQRAELGETIARQGGTIGAYGVRTYAALQEQAREDADSLAALSARRQIVEWKNKRLYDPNSGALNVRGRDAMGLPEQLQAEYDALAGTIEKGLNTDRQRAAFERMKVEHGLELDLTIQRHVAGEMNRYRAEELEASLSLSKASAAANALDPELAGADLARGVASLKEHLPRMGAGEKQVAAAVLKFQTETHDEIITRLLANSKDQAAKAYFEEARDAGQISGAALARIEAKVQQATTDANGERAAAAIWSELGPATDDEAISIDTMEAKARERWGDDTGSLKATISALRSRAEGVRAGRREREEVMNSTLWGAVARGESFNAIRRTPEFVNAPGDVQTRIRDYYENAAAREESRAAARENRAIAAEARKERELELKGWGAYLDFKADPAKLRDTTPGEILKRLPELGQAHVNRLLNDREKLLKDEETFRAAVIDRDLFNEVMHEAGVPGVYESPAKRSAAEKADLGRLLSTIEEAIARKQVAAGRRLTREETETIARETVDQKVLVKDGWFWNDERYPALVTIADVPADVQQRIRASLATVGLTNPSEQDIIDTYTRSLPKVKK